MQSFRCCLVQTCWNAIVQDVSKGNLPEAGQADSLCCSQSFSISGLCYQNAMIQNSSTSCFLSFLATCLLPYPPHLSMILIFFKHDQDISYKVVLYIIFISLHLDICLSLANHGLCCDTDNDCDTFQAESTLHLFSEAGKPRVFCHGPCHSLRSIYTCWKLKSILFSSSEILTSAE